MGPRIFATLWKLLWCNCSPVCGVSAWWLYDGLMLTSSKRTYTTYHTSLVCSSKSCSSCCRVTADPCLQRRHSKTQKQVFLSLLWRSLLLSPVPGAHKLCLHPLSVLVGLRFDFKCNCTLLQICWISHLPADMGYQFLAGSNILF